MPAAKGVNASSNMPGVSPSDFEILTNNDDKLRC
jgi:hypothetical protein